MSFNMSPLSGSVPPKPTTKPPKPAVLSGVVLPKPTDPNKTNIPPLAGKVMPKPSKTKYGKITTIAIATFVIATLAAITKQVINKFKK